MNSDGESPVARFITHEDTPWTAVACHNRYLDEKHLSQSPSLADASLESSPTALFSTREPSITTKPTSYGTDYLGHGQNKKSKADTTYTASLSATHGSGSEAEAEAGHDNALDATLFGAGAWSTSHQGQGQSLRRHEHARVRLSKSLPYRIKKPPVVLHQITSNAGSERHRTDPRTTIPPSSIKDEPKYLFHLIPRQHYIMLGLLSLIFLTVISCAAHLHSVDRAEAALRKRIVFGTTTLVVLEVIVTALAAQRTLLEASLLGLFPLGIGSMVLSHLDELV
ncbi:uncharacterized protein M421DRAFT_335609 [Didymella exigua CBS 183.55]|uniref:Uncharacterized protein n=1 Tax=Didymella exigua CBS 183.55 TaxID=1150837 RepID=A0A6A5R6X3_9PLEO|nr:uncharacterized protein M421DRAFT_335609 [Didymella exigua CBS 183.55]KAF1922970.1 hypothetical protein M421DRAFT_335609 [Didymella exigua CBS 183.55]